MRREQTHGAQVYLAVGQERLNTWKTTRRASRLDPVERRVLGQVKDLRAMGEHRGASLPQIKSPGVELRERRDQRGSGLPLGRGKTAHFVQQFRIRKVTVGEYCVVHIPVYHAYFRRHCTASVSAPRGNRSGTDT